MRQGFKEEHLSNLYNISQTTVSRIIISWINVMFLKFSTIPVWPSRQNIDEEMPADFKEKYSVQFDAKRPRAFNLTVSFSAHIRTTPPLKV